MSTQRDPVCGMTVDTEQQHAESTYAGNTYYFCSDNCRQRFDANPTTYSTSAESRSGTERHEPPHTTQNNMTSPMYGSAGSGGAEFQPMPERHDKDDIHEA